MPAAMMSETDCAAEDVSLNAASRVCTDSGRLTMRRVAWVAMPRVPSEPMKTPGRS